MDNWSAPVGSPAPVRDTTQTGTDATAPDSGTDRTLAIAGTDLPPSDVDLAFSATVVRRAHADVGPPVARVAVTNLGTEPLQVTTGHRPLFSAVRSDDGQALLVAAGPYSAPALESSDDREPGGATDPPVTPPASDPEGVSTDEIETITLEDGITVPLVMSGVPVDPGVTASVDLAVLSAETGTYLGPGTYRFEDSYAVYPPDDGTDSVGFDWGFSVRIDER